MCGETGLGESLVLGPGPAVIGVRMDADSTAWSEQSGDLDVLWIHELDEILHDDVHAVLVEVAVVAEREEVKLETLGLDHAFVRKIGDTYLGKIGLACNGTETGKLGTVEPNPVIILGVLVLKGFEDFGSVVLTIFGLLSERLKTFVFSCRHIIL